MIPASATVALRSTGEEDLDFVLREEGNEENRPFIGRWPRARHLDALASADTEHLILEREGARVGYAILTDLDDPGGVVCLKRLMIAEKGRGHGRTALRHLYASEGFVEEVLLRDALWSGERYESLVVMSILESEYRA